jgi:hypothetical protein
MWPLTGSIKACKRIGGVDENFHRFSMFSLGEHVELVLGSEHLYPAESFSMHHVPMAFLNTLKKNNT